MNLITNLRNIHFGKAFGYLSGQDEFRSLGDAYKVTGSGGQTFPTNMNSCAVRLSLALYRAGAVFHKVADSWLYTEPGGKKVYLPSLAATYRDRLLHGKTLSGNEAKQRTELNGKKGIIFFPTQGASGHVTLWNETDTSGDWRESGYDHDTYFSDVPATFWVMH